MEIFTCFSSNFHHNWVTLIKEEFPVIILKKELDIPVEQILWIILITISGLSIRKIFSEKFKSSQKKKSWFRIEDVEDPE